MKSKLLIFFFSLILFLTIPETSSSIDFKDLLETEKDKKINVESKSLIVKNDEDLAVFYDDVVVTQGDVTLKADKITVITEPIENSQRKRFKIIKAENTVRFSSSGRNASSDKAIYVIDDNLITLEGNVILQEKGNNIKGDKFTYNVRTAKSSIKSLNKDGSEAEKTRVRATITPGEKIGDVKIPIPPIKILKTSPKEKEPLGRGKR